MTTGLVATAAPAQAAAKITAGKVQVTGTVVVGKNITAKPEGFTAKPAHKLSYSYQWLRNGKTIKNATSKSYTIKSADKGKKLAVKIRAKAAGYSTTAWKKSTTVTANSIWQGKAKVTGTAQAGKTLKVTTSTFTGKPTTIAYQWLRNGKSIKGATKARYTLTTSDAGKKITVKVTAKRTGYKSRTVTSNTVKPTKPPITNGKASVSGSVQIGQRLTVKPTGFKPSSHLTYHYQWYRNGKKISSATKATYTTAKADAGTSITAKVTAKRSNYTQRTVTSNAVKVQKPVTPAISGGRVDVVGTPQLGSTLTANPSAFTPTSGATYKYQWSRDGKAITSATGKSYTPTLADSGKKITCAVTASKGGYTARTVSSTASVIKDRPARTTRINAHRGNSSVAPENTMASVKAAYSAGADMIEIDIDRLATGEFILMHDDTVDRTTNGTGSVGDLSNDYVLGYWEEDDIVLEDEEAEQPGLTWVPGLDAGYATQFGPEFAGEPVPTLTDVLEYMAEHPGPDLQVETKGPQTESDLNQIAAEIRNTGMGDRVVLMSFAGTTVKDWKRVAPDIREGLVTGSPSGFQTCLDMAVDQCVVSDALALSNPAMFWKVQDNGIGMVVWTVNTTTQYAAVMPLKPDYITTNFPADMR
ncbi:MAG: hypothetical protein LBH13_07830 [Cellulomonadaceae bacterium]|nr:hypothetical protein [Cellulomonadaceae bacterium]